MHTVTKIGVVITLVLAGVGRLCAQAPHAGTAVLLAQTVRDKARPGRKPVDPMPEKKKLSNTLITMELLTVGDGAALKAREWLEIIGKMDVTLTVRPGRAAEKLEITEKKAGGTLRNVMVKGMLDNRGQLIFPDQTFTASDTGKFAAWIEELRTYGAQGNPDGRPAWGLTKEQFGVIHNALKKPLDFDTKDVELNKVLEKFALPDKIPLKVSTAAARALKNRDGPVLVGQSLKGVSQGTALAILLGEQGLAFRPRRLPDGAVELTVTAADEATGVWPIGWPRRQSPPETAPTLFDIKPINLEDEPLDGILDAAAEVIGIPILIDRPAMEAKGIDLAKVMITQPPKKMAWTTALSSFTFKAKAKFELLIDEAGKPFLWVTPLANPGRQQKE